MAMQALTEYSYRARLRDITDMKVTIEATGEDGRDSHTVVVSTGNVSEMNIIPVRERERESIIVTICDTSNI